MGEGATTARVPGCRGGVRSDPAKPRVDRPRGEPIPSYTLFPYTLLLVALALITSLFVATFFRKPVALLLGRLFGEEIGEAWGHYVTFALAIVGVAGGVPMGDLERMVGASDARALVLNQEQWVLTVYESVIATLGALASALTLFFVVVVLGQVLVRRAEAKRMPVPAGVEGGG